MRGRLTAIMTVVVLALVGCSGGAAPSGLKSPSAAPSGAATLSGSPSPSGSPSAPPAPADISFSVAANATQVRPDTPLTVSVSHGTLTAVAARTGTGTQIQGSLDDGAARWTNTDALAVSTSYSVTATATGEDGATVTKTLSFSTLKGSGSASLTIIPGDDWEVGVGMPVVVVLSRAVPEAQRAGVVRALSVTSTPAVLGAWRWMSSTEVQWRPADYWPAGTKVVVKAGLSGAELAPGIWGRRTVTSTFSIGRQQISTVDVAAHTMTVRRDGEVLKTIPVTTGKSGFLTRDGVKIVMDKQATVRMDAATTGTDPRIRTTTTSWSTGRCGSPGAGSSCTRHRGRSTPRGASTSATVVRG